MTLLRAITTTQAPKAIGPYSQAIAIPGLLFVSGQLPLDPATGTMVEGTVAARAHRVFTNLRAVAEAAGCTMGDAIKTTVFLTDLADFPAVNAVYAEYFPQPHPARSAVQVAALPLGSPLEAEAIFVRRA
jgi:2-iminobutanoate/2-iminopropanoate deaminase